MNTLLDSVLSTYLQSYRGLIEAEPLEGGSVLISFPFHYSADHRIEVAVTRVSDDQYIVSDMARTIEELRNAGHEVQASTVSRLEELAKSYGLTFKENYMILESRRDELGLSIQKFVEAAKTVGDVYLTYRPKFLAKEEDLVREVKDVLGRRSLPYRERDKVRGRIEKHSVDFLIPPNGRPGIAIAILSGSNAHLTAEAWGFKAGDIRQANPKLKVGLVYDVISTKWSSESTKILEQSADLAVPGNALSRLDEGLVREGIAERK